jgi:hypothetical protein
MSLNGPEWFCLDTLPVRGERQCPTGYRELGWWAVVVDLPGTCIGPGGTLFTWPAKERWRSERPYATEQEAYQAAYNQIYNNGGPRWFDCGPRTERETAQ